MKLEQHLEIISESMETLDTLINEKKGNPQELANYYRDMKRLNPKASPWIIFLGMADEAGIKIPKSIEHYEKLSKKEAEELDKALRQYSTQIDKLLAQFPPREKKEIEQSRTITGPWLPQKSGTEVAKEMGITRQGVSSSTKKGLPKAYQAVRAMHPQLAPFEAFMELAKQFGVREQAGKLLKLMPKKIQDEIRKDSEKFGG